MPNAMMEIKNITTKNIINKYNNSQFNEDADEEFVMMVNICNAS